MLPLSSRFGEVTWDSAEALLAPRRLYMRGGSLEKLGSPSL